MILKDILTKDGKYLSVTVNYNNMIADHDPGYTAEYVKRGVCYKYADVVQIFDSNMNEYRTYLVLSNRYLVSMSVSTERFFGEDFVSLKHPCCRYDYRDTSRLAYAIQLDVKPSLLIKNAIQFQDISSHEAFHYVIKLWEFIDGAPELYHHLYNYTTPLNW